MNSKKGQIAIEFLIVFSFVLIVFVFLFAIITQQRAVQQNYQTFSQLQLVAQSVSLQLSRAAASPSGFSEQIPITTTEGLTPYNISISRTGIVILTATSGPQTLHTTSYSNVQGIVSNPAFFSNGLYVLPISNGSIYIQNSFGNICVDYSCPTTANQSYSISLSSENTHVPQFSGNGLSLNGNPSFIQTNSIMSFDRNTQFSIAFWVNTQVTGQDGFLVGTSDGLGASSAGVQAWLWHGSDAMQWRLEDTSGDVYAVSGVTNVEDGKWHYITVTYNGISNENGMAVYVDGKLDAVGSSSPISVSINPTGVYYNAQIAIGGANQDKYYPFTGSLSNVQVYSTALSQNQILQFYQAGITSAPQTNSIVSWWPLNGNTNDYSGSGNNGAVSGSLVYPAVSQIFATVRNSMGKPTSNTLVGFTTTLGNFTNGKALTVQSQEESNFTNSNGIATVFLNQRQISGQALVGATAFNGNLSTQNNLVGWYPMNQGFGNTSFDLKSGNNGQISGEASWGSPYYSANFSGPKGFISTPLQYNYGVGTGITITGWIYPTNLSAFTSIPLLRSDFELALLGSNLWFYTFGLGSAGGGTVRQNAWNFVSATVTGPVNPTVNLSINGVQVSSTSYSGTLGSSCGSQQNYMLGGTNSTACGSPPLDFQGKMANFQVYNFSLTPSQISHIYSEGIGGAPLQATLLAGWWPLNGNVNDYSKNNKNGTLFGNVGFSPLLQSLSASQIGTGNVNRILAASFNGLSDIDVGNIIKINSVSNWTVSFWMNSTAVVEYKNPLDMNFVPSANNAGPRFEQGGAAGTNSLNLVVGSSASSYTVYPYTNTILPNTWYYVVAARSGESVIGYLNGVQVFDQPNTKWPSAFGNMTLGRGYANSANRWYLGNLSNVQVYNQTLSPSQISQLYYGGIADTPIPNTQLAAWYPLEGSANDYSLSGYTPNSVANVIYKGTMSYSPYLVGAQGISLNGQNGYVSAGQNINAPKGLTYLTWIKLNSYPNAGTQYSQMFYEFGGAGAQLYTNSLISNDLTFAITAGTFNAISTNTPMALNAWYMIAGEYLNSNMMVCSFGPVGNCNSKAFSGTISGTGTSISIGSKSGSQFFVNGTMADSQIYQTGLGLSQLEQLYDSGMPATATTNVTLGWYP